MFDNKIVNKLTTIVVASRNYPLHVQNYRLGVNRCSRDNFYVT